MRPKLSAKNKRDWSYAAIPTYVFASWTQAKFILENSAYF